MNASYLVIQHTHYQDLYWSDRLNAWVPYEIADAWELDAFNVLSLPEQGIWRRRCDG